MEAVVIVLCTTATSPPCYLMPHCFPAGVYNHIHTAGDRRSKRVAGRSETEWFKEKERKGIGFGRLIAMIPSTGEDGGHWNRKRRESRSIVRRSIVLVKVEFSSLLHFLLSHVECFFHRCCMSTILLVSLALKLKCSTTLSNNGRSGIEFIEENGEGILNSVVGIHFDMNYRNGGKRRKRKALLLLFRWFHTALYPPLLCYLSPVPLNHLCM